MKSWALLLFCFLLKVYLQVNFLVNIYLFKINNRNTRKRCEICSKSTIKTTERRQWRRCCPLPWMFSTREVNHKTNRLHERGLRALLNDETSTFNDMLSKSNDTTIHVKNIQKLIIEFHKYLYRLSAPIMNKQGIKIYHR